MSDDSEFEVRPVIYAGQWWNYNKNTMLCKFILLSVAMKCETVAEAELRMSLFSVKSKMVPPVIGQAFDIKCMIKNDTVHRIELLPKWKYNRSTQQLTSDKNEWIAKWEAHSYAAAVEQRARKTLAKIEKDSKLVDALSSLRRDYHSTDRIGRLALKVAVLDVLES